MDFEITIDGYAFPIILSALLGYLYRWFDKADGTSYLSDRIKNGIPVILSVGLALAMISYNNLPYTSITIWKYSIYGFFMGLATIGTYNTIGIQIRGTKKSIKKILSETSSTPVEIPDSAPQGLMHRGEAIKKGE